MSKKFEYIQNDGEHIFQVGFPQGGIWADLEATLVANSNFISAAAWDEEGGSWTVNRIEEEKSERFEGHKVVLETENYIFLEKLPF